MRQRKLCDKGHSRSYLSRPVRWRVCVCSDRADCRLADCGSLQLSLRRGNKSCLYQKKTNNPAVLDFCSESCVKKAKTPLNFFLFVSWVFPPRSDCFHFFRVCLMKLWNPKHCKELYLCLLVGLVHAEVIVALNCGLTACTQVSAPLNTELFNSQTWHTRPQQDCPPHESV